MGSGGTVNFHPEHMTREELLRRQMLLYQRLYEPSAFEARFLGNLSRFRDIHFQPERTRVSSFVMLGRIARQYLERGRRRAEILCAEFLAWPAAIATADRADGDLPGNVFALLQGARADAGVGSVADGAAGAGSRAERVNAHPSLASKSHQHHDIGIDVGDCRIQRLAVT